MKENKYRVRYFTIATSLLIVFLLVWGFIFITDARKGLYAEKLNYLETISLKSAENVQKDIRGHFQTLEAMATFIGSSPDFDVQAALSVIEKEVEKNSFKRMGIILPDGRALTTDGHSYDFNDRTYFREAMKGHTNVSDCLLDKADGKEINVFAAPIYQKGTICGVIFCTKTQENFSKSMAIDSFHGEGYSYIINTAGNLVVKPTHPDSLTQSNNLFQEMRSRGLTSNQMEQDIQNGVSGSFEYTRDHIKRQVCYTSVGVSDWYLVSAVPAYVISEQSDALIRNLIILVVLIVGLALLVSFGIFMGMKKNNSTLERLAYIDPITGCSTWAKFNIEAAHLLTNYPSDTFAMAILDINKFKVINDMFGHEKGNEILTYLSHVLKKNLGEQETFCRTSADNFNLLIRYKDEKTTLHRMNQIKSLLENHMSGYKIELSIGVYPISDHSADINVLSDRANISRALAKSQGAHFCHFFKEENRIEIIKEKEIENIMDAALNNREFQVYLQPKYRINTGKIMGAEALVRWKKKDGTILSPGEFIPLFEKNGFIKKLDIYMFSQVCGLLSRWQKEATLFPVLPLSVNISRVHLSNPHLPEELLAIAMEYGVPSNLIEIELTESALFLGTATMIKQMESIKNAGFLISIDDFGSGYSSLSSLKDLPADFVKIDKCFLDEAVIDVRGETLIHSMVSMIQGLGLTTVSEGAETAEQVKILKEAHCDIAQGFFYAKPMPVKEFEALL